MVRLYGERIGQVVAHRFSADLAFGQPTGDHRIAIVAPHGLRDAVVLLMLDLGVDFLDPVH